MQLSDYQQETTAPRTRASGVGRARIVARGVAVAAFGWVVFFAPFDVAGWINHQYRLGRPSKFMPLRGWTIVVAPIWTAPTQDAAQEALARLPDYNSVASEWELDSVELSTGRLAVLLVVAVLAGTFGMSRPREG